VKSSGGETTAERRAEIGPRIWQGASGPKKVPLSIKNPRQWRYQHSARGQATQERYRASSKRKACWNRYNHSPTRLATQKRYRLTGRQTIANRRHNARPEVKEHRRWMHKSWELSQRLQATRL
jgi:hypothetical protein